MSWRWTGVRADHLLSFDEDDYVIGRSDGVVRHCLADEDRDGEGPFRGPPVGETELLRMRLEGWIKPWLK